MRRLEARTWDELQAFLAAPAPAGTVYFFRGQRDPSWPLASLSSTGQGLASPGLPDRLTIVTTPIDELGRLQQQRGLFTWIRSHRYFELQGLLLPDMYGAATHANTLLDSAFYNLGTGQAGGAVYAVSGVGTALAMRKGKEESPCLPLATVLASRTRWVF